MCVIVLGFMIFVPRRLVENELLKNLMLRVVAGNGAIRRDLTRNIHEADIVCHNINGRRTCGYPTQDTMY